MKKRILLMYSPHTSGHQQAALAIQAAIKEIKSETEILTIDLFNYNTPVLEKVVVGVYLNLLKRIPRIWGYLYDNRKFLNRTSGIKNIIYRVNSGKLEKILKDFQPQVIVCTQAFPCGVVADYKRRSGSNILLIGVLTDYLPHSYWICQEVNWYVVSSAWARQYLIKSGITKERIINHGIPVHPKFRYQSNRSQVLKGLELNPDLPIMLIMGGWHGAGPIEETIYQLNKIDLDFQIIVVTGINKSLRNSLEKKKQFLKPPIKVLGYIDNIDEVMGVSTLIITKPGGLTCAEALAKGLPIIMLESIPGQEANNAQFLSEQGVALRASNGKEAAEFASQLMKEPAELNRMRCKIQEISDPHAALKIAKLALEA